MSKVYFDSHPGYTEIGYKNLNRAKEKFPIGTIFVKYVPSEHKEQMEVAKEFMGEKFFIPERLWKYKILKPKEVLGEVTEFQTISKIVGYFFDEHGTYWPVTRNEKTHSLNFTYIPESEIENYE